MGSKAGTSWARPRSSIISRHKRFLKEIQKGAETRDRKSQNRSRGLAEAGEGEKIKMKDRNGLSLQQFLKEELADPEVRKHYEEAKAEWLVAKAVAAARKRAHLTQVQLAKRIKTDQKAIWRLEAGRQNATVGMLWKIALATDSCLRVSLVPRH
jgi:DNA-binding XRE family transcriptional regulator